MAEIKFNKKIFQAGFQITIAPRLDFYNNLFKRTELHTYFPDWETDRLFVTLKDYKKHHSLNMKFDSFSYSTDDFKESELLKLVDLLKENIIYEESEKIGFGFKLACLVDANLNFQELVDILNLKFFSLDFIEKSGKLLDNSITVIYEVSENIHCRLLIGPMRRSEVSNFIKINLKDHFYKSETNRLIEINKILESYPLNSIYFEFNFFTPKNTEIPLDGFLDASLKNHSVYLDNILNYLLQIKIAK